ncbi:MAG: acyl-CoA dehydrogenase [Rhodospirillales bacterium CG15_BIG_FIL_POST_REV_8_21_14_020_66_15]|nr:MAG: acyl-CoA dehydrogenase [Rhodospirillales bacterium CG15_BIG_FIL_POST_REV_8_21_14_020_66_15]
MDDIDPNAPLDMDHLRSWIGKTQELTDVIGAFPARALAATLDRDDAAPRDGDALPPSAHWLYFLETPRHSDLAFDGHAKKGGFLPPVPLPRRMWAGGRIRFPGTLRVGDRATRLSTVKDVSFKDGKSGRLVFVLVEHRIKAGGQDVIVEEHDIVYRDMGDPNAPPPPPKSAPEGAEWTRKVLPDEAMLFRYSALIFNAHRIHFDREFTRNDEGYPDLIVHGPLIATLLMDLGAREMAARGRRMTRFAYRAVRPSFTDGRAMTFQGRPSADGAKADLWALDQDGWLAMQAEADFEAA